MRNCTIDEEKVLSLFISFEGGEGSGKTTQSKALKRRLSRAGYTATLVHEPGSTPTGERIRRWLKTGSDLTPLAELFLFSAARSLLVESVIRPALDGHDVVVCDRYTYSTVAYQGYGRGMDVDTIRQLNDLASSGLVPDLVVLLDVPVPEGMARKGNGAGDRFEAESREFHQRVRQGYLDMACREPKRWLTIDSTRPLSHISNTVWERVSRALTERP